MIVLFPAIPVWKCASDYSIFRTFFRNELQNSILFRLTHGDCEFLTEISTVERLLEPNHHTDLIVMK